jgi:hypothetical protein
VGQGYQQEEGLPTYPFGLGQSWAGAESGAGLNWFPPAFLLFFISFTIFFSDFNICFKSFANVIQIKSNRIQKFYKNSQQGYKPI